MRRQLLSLAVLGAFGVGIAIGCGGDDSPGGSVPSTPPPGVATSKRIGASGGTVEVAGGPKIEIPEGALAADTEVTIASDESAAPAAETTSLGTMWLFGPEGLQFAKPVKVTLPFDAAKIAAGRTADEVRIVTAPKGTTAWTALASTVAAASVTAEVTHFSYFNPALLDCGAICAGTSMGTCSCEATCLGTTYSMQCANDSCTCGDGRTGTTTCADPAVVRSSFREACGFPGRLEGAPPGDGGSDSGSSDCVLACSGSGSACECSATCSGVAYAMTCSDGSCSCLEGGAVKKSTPGTCDSPSALCSVFASGCGFPVECGSAPNDAGSDASDGSCSPVGCNGQAGTCSCNQTCSSTAYSLVCEGTACTCNTNGTPTKSFTGSGGCDDFAECGYP